MHKSYFLISFVLSIYIRCSNLFTRVLLSQPTALCLDGSPGAYYFSPGSGVNTSKFLIWFQGGGWCGSHDLSSTISSCYSRSLGTLGSSLTYPQSQNMTSGILSGNATANPTFFDWNRVILKYCDGTGHQGTKTNPINYKSKDIYFRGQNITIGQFDSLNNTHKLFTTATQIVITGGSAGGLAAYHWTNYVYDHAKGGKVWAAPDAGIFLDVINFTSYKYDYRERFISFMKIANQQVNQPVSQCNVKYSSELWRCMFAQNIHPFIKAPLFPVNSLYDSWSIPNILGITCQVNGSLNNCTADQRKILQQYKVNTTKVLKQITSKNINGAWGIACSHHTSVASSAWISTSYRIPQNSINSIDSVISGWMRNQSTSHQHIDSVSWPQNKPCSGVQNKNLIVDY